MARLPAQVRGWWSFVRVCKCKYTLVRLHPGFRGDFNQLHNLLLLWCHSSLSLSTLELPLSFHCSSDPQVENDLALQCVCVLFLTAGLCIRCHRKQGYQVHTRCDRNRSLLVHIVNTSLMAPSNAEFRSDTTLPHFIMDFPQYSSCFHMKDALWLILMIVAWML